MWQKVTNDEHAHYKDFCNPRKTHDRPEKIYRKIRSQGLLVPKNKNDLQSTVARNIGNESFMNGKFLSAMNSYNRSLCAAEIPELMSLAYGNRSAVFFELKQYDKCLRDIELAKKLNFPEHLMPKLVKRQEACLAQTGSNGREFQPKLSFEPSKNFPEMANVLEIKYEKQYGRHIVANCDIDVGETIVMEKAFQTAHRYEKFRRCDSCMKKDLNFIPCPNCSETMFCSNECSTSVYHQVECNMNTIPDEFCNDNQLNIIRSILQAIYTFTTVDELQSFVEDAISSDQSEIPESILDEKSRYRAFLKLWYEPKAYERDTFAQQVYFVYQTFLENEIIGPKFNSARKKRFLMHLVAQHYCIVNYSGNIVFDNSDDRVGWDANEFRSVLASYVNHSCAPNVTLLSYDGYNVLVTIRPIKAGEQIFVSYFRNDRIQHSKTDRNVYLLARSRFSCKCERCNGDKPTAEEQDAMKFDPCYQYIKNNKREIDFRSDNVKKMEVAAVLEQKCVEWLNRHGQKKWCDETDCVTDTYRRLLALKYNDQIRF